MTAETPFVNPYWRQLAEARPRLHDQVRVTRQEVRGRLWHVIEDGLSGKQFRVTPEAWYFIGLLDGSRTVEEAMAAAAAHLGETAPGQGEVLRLVGQLHSIGALSGVDSVADVDALYERGASMRRRKLLQQARSPLAIRVRLIDPDRLLARLQPLSRAVFSPMGFLLWIAVVGYGLATALVNLDELSHNFLDRVLAAENVVAITVVFAVMKLFHEFGHGMAVKRWGGEVHEMGIMFLVLIPIPYVDATAANSFASRLRRLVVSSAGMYVEMFLAAVAIILWSLVEPGIVRALLYNAALVGSVSTLLFNINPLLRFDGYYILSDAAELPNLGTRAQRYFRYLLQRWVLWLDDAATPETDPAEKRWLLIYQVAAATYRIFIIMAIAFFVAKKFFFVGVVLAIWAAAQFVVVPLVGALRFLVFSPRLQRRRWISWGRAGLAAGVVAAILFALPAPRTTAAWGVVWVPPEGEIVAATDGFVRSVPAAEGAAVQAGEVLILARNAPLMAERKRLEARRRALETRYRAEFTSDRVAAGLTRMELAHAEERLAAVSERIEGLAIRASVDGRFALALPEDMEGRYVRRGELLGFVIREEGASIRVAVGQRDIGLVRDDLSSIALMPVAPWAAPVDGRLLRAIPRATNELPTMALSTLGGGDIEMAEGENGQSRAVEDLFHFEIVAEGPGFDYRVGQKVHVKFRHSPEPVGFQLWRRLRQLFLSELEV